MRKYNATIYHRAEPAYSQGILNARLSEAVTFLKRQVEASPGYTERERYDMHSWVYYLVKQIRKDLRRNPRNPTLRHSMEGSAPDACIEIALVEE